MGEILELALTLLLTVLEHRQGKGHRRPRRKLTFKEKQNRRRAARKRRFGNH